MKKGWLNILFLICGNFMCNAKFDDEDEDNSRNGFMAFHTFRPLWDTPGIETTTKKDKEGESKTKKSDHDNAENNDSKDQFVSNADLLSEFNKPMTINNADVFSAGQYPQPNPCFNMAPACPPPTPYSCGCSVAQPPPRCVPKFCPPPPMCPPPAPPVFCPPPPPCMPRPCPPPPPPPPPPMQCPCTPAIYIQPNDCCVNCHRPCAMNKSKFMLTMRGTRILTKELEHRTAMCNNYILRNIIGENISHDIDQSKRSIQTEAEKQLGKQVNVICGHGEFSFTIYTDSYCQYSFYEVSCYAYHQ